MSKAAAWLDDPDPQLAVERRLRSRGRSGSHSDLAIEERITTWKQPDVVTTARCRVKSANGGVPCVNLIAVTQDALDQIEQFSRLLAARGEAPLELNECFPCEACLDRARLAEADRNRDKIARVRHAVRQLKGDEAATDEEQREALLFLEKKFGPAYCTELQLAIAEKRGGGNKRRGKAADL